LHNACPRNITVPTVYLGKSHPWPRRGMQCLGCIAKTYKQDKIVIFARDVAPGRAGPARNWKLDKQGSLFLIEDFQLPIDDCSFNIQSSIACESPSSRWDGYLFRRIEDNFPQVSSFQFQVSNFE